MYVYNPTHISVAVPRDVTSGMAADGVEDIRDFKWESQLRYYWEHHEAPPSGVPAQVSAVCCMGYHDGHMVQLLHCIKYRIIITVLHWLLGRQDPVCVHGLSRTMVALASHQV